MVRSLIYLIGLISIWITINNVNGQIGVSLSQQIESSGYIVRRYILTTSDNYKIELLRIGNPTINGGVPLPGLRPVLFVHGVLTSGKCFVAPYIDGVKPVNLLAKIGDPTKLEDADLGRRIRRLAYGGSISMAYTAVNFALDTWILSRRGTFESLAAQFGENFLRNYTNQSIANYNSSLKALQDSASNPTSGNLTKAVKQIIIDATIANNVSMLWPLLRSYWNYSLDEQAKRDIPEAIRLILNETGSDKLIYFGHSAGGGLNILAQAVNPDLADNMSLSLLWSPGADLGHDPASMLLGGGLTALSPALRVYGGPVLPIELDVPLQTSLASICSDPTVPVVTCKQLVELFFGPTDEIQIGAPAFWTFFPFSSSVGELLWFANTAERGKASFYDQGSPFLNKQVYGSFVPPLYPVEDIRSTNIVMWSAISDTLVPAADIEFLANRMSVPVERRYLNWTTSEQTNHVNYFLYHNLTERLIAPSLKMMFLASLK